MKKYPYTIICSVLIVLFSCGKEHEDNLARRPATDCNTGKIIKSAVSKEGVIYYNSFEKVFTVIYTTPNTYDSQDNGIPCDLAENLKIDGQKVIFSGDYRDYGKAAPIGGQKYYYLDISKITVK